ncbi:MAG: choice-of-anchor X domain-containing protein, partial [Eubacterium sp.]
MINFKKRASVKVISMLLVMAVFILPILAGCDSGEESSEIILQNFSADETYFVAGTESVITFTVDAKGIADSVNLCNGDGTVVGVMHDDGIDGDAAADDGTYTYMLTNTYKMATSEEYYIKAGNNVSESINIYSFDMPKDEAAVAETKQAIEDVQQDISEIEVKYTDSRGYVASDSVSDVITEV